MNAYCYNDKKAELGYRDGTGAVDYHLEILLRRYDDRVEIYTDLASS